MNTKALRQKVLDLAIHGKLVPQNPNDESATVLLEKIRAEKAEKIKKGELKADKKDSFIFVGSDKRHYEQFADGTIKDIEDEIPFDVPEGWAWCRLGNIGKWQSGTTPNKKNLDYYKNGTIPWLLTGDLNDGLVTEIPNCITEKAFKETSLKINPIGSVCIAMYGATIGKLGILNTSATTNQACCVCYEFYGINNKYLFYFLKEHKEEFIQQGFGGAQPNISKEKIVDTFIPLPPLSEQECIVKSIETYFEQIDSLEENKYDLQIAIKKTKSKILDLAIHGKLVPQDPNDESAEELLKRIATSDNRPYKKFEEDEVPFIIPFNWKWERLAKISSIISKGTTPRGGKNAYCIEGINYLRVENISADGTINLEDINHISENEHLTFLKRSILQENDVIISIAGTLGKIGIIRKCDLPMNTNQAIAFVRISNLSIINLKYLRYVLESVELQRLLLSQTKVTSIPNLTLEIINNCPIPLPPIQEQNRIVSKIEELFSDLDSISSNLE